MLRPGIVIVPLLLPLGYLWKTYVTAPGDRWRFWTSPCQGSRGWWALEVSAIIAPGLDINCLTSRHVPIGSFYDHLCMRDGLLGIC